MLATDTAASKLSSTVVKRSCAALSSSRMRLGSVMSVIDVIQPVCTPLGSTKGETYIRAAKIPPFFLCTRTSNPDALERPFSSSSKRPMSMARSSSGQ